MRQSRWILSALVGFSWAAQLAGAAEPVDRYPSKPLRVVVGSTPGATPDVLARMIGAKLGESWKQSVVIENRVPSLIAYNSVAKSTPDGYTLLLASPALAIRAVVSLNLPYDTATDFAGVTEIGFSNVVVVVGPGLGVKSIKELGRILAMPGVREKLSAVAFHITPSTPEEHDKKLRADIAAFVKEIGLQVN
jgi:tripartite-type tricarboxylate transporter receptor subunit TctC